MQIIYCFLNFQNKEHFCLISGQFDTFPTYNFEIIKELNVSVLIWTELHLIFRISHSMLKQNTEF